MSDTPAQTRLSATVLLLRDTADFEVLMVKRHYQIDFASGALVFPGGKANDEDADPAWAALVDCDLDGDQRTARIAAVREAFEESGVLLARPSSARGSGNPLIGAETVEPLAPLRGPIDRRETSFLEMIRDNQIASHDGRETTDTLWVNPNSALEKAEAGEVTIIFPTRMVLGKLGEANSLSDATSKFSEMKVVTVEPELSKDEDGNLILRIPAEAGYMTTIEPLQRAKDEAGGPKS